MFNIQLKLCVKCGIDVLCSGECSRRRTTLISVNRDVNRNRNGGWNILCSMFPPIMGLSKLKLSFSKGSASRWWGGGGWWWWWWWDGILISRAIIFKWIATLHIARLLPCSLSLYRVSPSVKIDWFAQEFEETTSHSIWWAATIPKHWLFFFFFFFSHALCVDWYAFK